jgi:hypothetical protein
MDGIVSYSLAKKYSLKMNNVGVASAISDGDGITWTLKDGTQLNMSIANWHNLTKDEQKVLAMLSPMSNDNGATYFGTDLNRYNIDQSQTNNNKPYLFTTNDWTKVSDDKYTLTRIHNLGDVDIIPYVKNSSGKAETVGIDTSVANIITLESTSVFDGKIILNHSSSNGNKINSICTVNSSYIFTSIAERDAYFGITNISALKNGLLCMVNDGTNKTLYTWEDVDSPSTYNASLWHNSTALIKGSTGDKGDSPNFRWSGTKLAFEKPDNSWGEYIDLKGNTGETGTKFNPCGTYDPLVNYISSADSMDVVSYNSKTYCCLKNCTGKQPDLDANKEYWGLLIDGVLETQNDWILDTTDIYPKMRMKLVNGDLFDVVKNGSDNKCVVYGDITRSTHIDSSEDIILGKIDNSNDVSFDINTDSSETESITQCIFDYTPSHGGYVTAISMDLSNVQTSTQVRFIVKDKNTSETIYNDNFIISDFASGTDASCYSVTNGAQTVILNKPFALANPDTHTFEFYFNKTVTIKGKTISSVFVPKCHITAKEISIETVATQEWSLDNFGQNLMDSLSPHGMKDMSNSEMSFNESTRIFSIKPKSGATSFTYYLMGVRQVITTEKTIQIPNTTTVYYITLDNNGVLSYNSSYSVDDFSKLPLLFIRWNSTLQKAESLWDNRIGNLWLDPQTRSYILQNSGTIYNNGFQISNTLNGDGSNDSQAQISLTEGSFKIAERNFYITNSATATNTFENKMSPILYTKSFYRLGNTSDFTVDDVSILPLKKGIILPYYNKNTSGTWSLTEATSGNFISVFIGVSTDIRANSNFFSILGQSQDTTLLNAKANQTFQNLDLGNLNKKSCKILYKLTYQVKSSYTSNIKAILVDVEDLRSIASIEVTASSTLEHNSLANRNAPHAHTSDAIDINVLSPLADSTTSIKIQNADKSKNLVVYDTQNGYITNNIPVAVVQLTSAQRLSLTNMPLYVVVYDSTLGCNMQCIDNTNGIWVQI